jgi:AcrR family transcriptional regulator
MKNKRIAKGSGREMLLQAATELFLENGFESTSPQAIYAKSGVGQGSFYHHFTSKIDLMNAVLVRLVADKTAQLTQINNQTSSPLRRIELYLDVPRAGIKGCTFGRFVYESSLSKSELSVPISQFFDSLLNFLTMNIAAAQDEKLINVSMPPRSMAKLIVSQIQGSYILSRIYNDGSILTESILTVRALLGLSSNK